MRALMGVLRSPILGILILAIGLFTAGVLALEPIEPRRLLLYDLLLLISLAAALLHGMHRPLDRLVRSLRTRDPALLAPLARQNTGLILIGDRFTATFGGYRYVLRRRQRHRTGAG